MKFEKAVDNFQVKSEKKTIICDLILIKRTALLATLIDKLAAVDSCVRTEKCCN